jgi:hypothetical protein
MRATRWEFEHRAVIIGMLFAVAFAMAPLDRRNAAVALASVLAPHLGGVDRVTRAIIAAGALVAACRACCRR